MTDESNNPIKTTKPRRWFRFRLRTLLVMVTLLSVPLGWVGWELDQRRREKVVVAWIEEMGGQAFFDGTTQGYLAQGFFPKDGFGEKGWWDQVTDRFFGRKVRTVFCVEKSMGDLSLLAEMKDLEVLYLESTQVSDLSPLRELNGLRSICLDGTQVTDLSPLAELKNLDLLSLGETQINDLSPLAELKNLNELWINDTLVSDLSPLAELKSLELIYLENTSVSDLSPLAGLHNLKDLNLDGTEVSDLTPLVKLKNLYNLYLENTQVSNEQVQELQQALPNCHIAF